MANEKLIRASDARRAILKEDPKLAYCIDEIPGVDAVGNEKPCNFCKGRAYTKRPVTIITIYGKRFQMVFEHCPNCGRKLRTENGK